MTYSDTIARLYDLRNAENVIFKERKFGIVSNNALGIYHKELKMIATELGHDNELALQLFDSGIYEGRLLCSMMLKPKDVTEALMEKWVKTFDNWEICDSFSMGLFSKSNFAFAKIVEWTGREPEFEKRAGFACLASFCMADKTSENELFEKFFPIIIREATDERLYVKKAVNWALRNIGKRNIDLNRKAIEVAKQILEIDLKSAKWIAKNALVELQKENSRMSDYPRAEYRTSIMH
ncbi:DNA alkylation repair protein [Algoriphagus chordae]|uniref:3-methyladenine DNA glycosylase AlkD n=1 Tax=Algoriphagus chordae TaxID=237019 RepID=A0A2W7RAB6_9BACT|nr:DNA alkylation repair protein [Algoriphagus chordae]PZX57903.1 3-methyladenine DNA glycosylase AlkD [Algoriphagus chordae]